jgi:hypothetical protein
VVTQATVQLAVWVLTAQLGLRVRNLAKLAVMARRAETAARVVSVE